jgi:hypothetical protein
MQHILIHKIIGEKYLKWIAILKEFDLELVSSKSKKYLVFNKLMLEIPQVNDKPRDNNLFINELLFLIDSSKP